MQAHGNCEQFKTKNMTNMAHNRMTKSYAHPVIIPIKVLIGAAFRKT